MYDFLDNARRDGFLFFLILILSQPILSQKTKQMDSLIGILNQENNSKDKVITILKKIALDHPNTDSALFYANKALDLSLKTTNASLQAEIFEVISVKEHKLGNNNSSLEFTFKALKIYDSLGLEEKKAASYTQLANNYMSNQDYSSAIQYLKEAKHIYSISNSDDNHLFTILNLGEMYRLAHHLDSAIASFRNVLELNKTIKNDIVESYALGNLGMIFNTQDSLVIAKNNLEDAIIILKKFNDSYATSIYLAELGDVYQKENYPKEAEESYLEALNMAKETNLKEQIRDFSEKLTRFYETQGKYAEALIYQKQFQIYQDSLVNKTNIQEIERLKAGYEIDKRESQINLLNTLNTKQKYLLWTIGSGAFATLVFLFLIYKVNQRVKQANIRLTEQKVIIEESEQEKTLLLRELNHRVKNNLQLVSSLLSLQSNELSGHPAKEALVTGQYRIEALSLVHRKLYQEGVESKVELKEYIEELVLGLFHSYGMSFTPEIKVFPITIGIDSAVPIALIINELVTNAIKYAYKNNNNPSLKIWVKNSKGEVTIEIMDNGDGFTKKEQSKSNSLGIKLVTSLALQLGGELNLIESLGTHWKLTLIQIES